MNEKNGQVTLAKLAALVLLASSIVFGLGCTGDTDGGTEGEEDFAGTQFVATDDSVGTIRLNVTSNSIPVSEISSFSVTVRDASGRPVPQIQISCDTEAGLAILEPTSGAELTDSFGTMSGVVGCEAPGSFQLACRLPIGANRRKFETIQCTGGVPTGFAGFGGATGGGLGGGVDTTDGSGIGGTDTDGVRMTSILLFDTGDASGDDGTTSIDVAISACPDAETVEPFFDTLIKVGVINNTNQLIRFTKLKYTVLDSDGAGTTFTSKELSLIGEAEVLPSGGENQFITLFADVIGGVKHFAGSSTAIPALGFRVVTVRLIGTNDLGEEIVVAGRTTLSFDNFYRCSE